MASTFSSRLLGLINAAKWRSALEIVDSSADIAAIEADILALQGDVTALEDALDERINTLVYIEQSTPGPGMLALDGSAFLIATYPKLAAKMYCGDAANGTAEWGYKATTNVSPSSNRSTSGTYMVLPNGAAEFLRGWDNGRGVDSGRTLWSYQSDAIRNITGALPRIWYTAGAASGAFAKADAASNRPGTGSATAATDINFDASLVVPTAGENRPRNFVGLACIWYRGLTA